MAFAEIQRIAVLMMNTVRWAYCAAVVFFLFLLSGCGREDTAVFVPAALADKALADTSSVEYKILASDEGAGNDGVIAVFGALDETAAVTEMLLISDMFENIDGKAYPDSLPDFAGETVTPVFDLANAPYRGYFDVTNEDFIREIAVSGFIASVSGKCSSSVFDRSLSREKPEAKLLILSSQILSGYGYDDIVYILSASGRNTGVLTTVRSAVSASLEKMTEGTNIGLWAQPFVVSSGVYGDAFRSLRSSYTDKKSTGYADWAADVEFVCLSPEISGIPAADVRSYMDSYLAAGYTAPLSSVIVDDLVPESFISSMNAEAGAIAGSDLPEDEKYRQVLAEGFSFVSPVKAVVSDSYRWLRKYGRFTHRISFPEVSAYITAPSSEVSEENLDGNGMFAGQYRYNRAAGSEIGTYRFIPAGPRYLTPEIREKLDSLAPVTYNKLVYVY